MKPEVDDAVVERMVAMARQLGSKTPDATRHRQFIATLEERVAARHTRTTRRRQLATTLVLAAASLGLLFWLVPRSEHPLSYRVSGGALSEGSIVGQTGTSVAFSDGSKLKLTNGARARVGEVTAHGARVDLLNGEVAVDIVKAQGNAWFVQAGPYQVRVVGTEFDVRWAEERHRLEVDLHRGSVVVTGPHIEGQLRLQAGQRLTSATDGSSTVTPVGAATPALPAAAASASSPPTPDPVAVPEAEPAADLGPTSVERRDPAAIGWPRLVAQGDFQRVLDAAQRRGVDSVLASGTQPELAALADAARYGRNPALARRALLAERKRFAKAAAARGAAFFLGGIEPDGSAAALTWYETYLSESPRGPYAPQALGRRMMIVHRRGGSAASAPLAREYLQRFAQGPYASAAHKILESSP
ncbi:MAG TPA: FecR family protein [Polyangiaceae bacterium]|nr:FecR family protein [Polyangiaceae bacterium]